MAVRNGGFVIILILGLVVLGLVVVMMRWPRQNHGQTNVMGYRPIGNVGDKECNCATDRGSDTPVCNDSGITVTTHATQSGPKTILFWSQYYNKKNWLVDAGSMKCGPYTCNLSYDTKEYAKASALVFHHRTMLDWLKKLPPSRLPEQRWVLYNRESAWWDPMGSVLNRANNLINWTMGFRSDDDVVIPTAIITRGQFGDGFDPNRNYLDGRTGDVVGLMSMACSSNPHGYLTRKLYIDSLKRYGLKFDMYGVCGKRCGTFAACSAIMRRYKFVLSLENSLCDDYVSEKPYLNGFMLGVVPVVMSGANLSDPYVMPPGSFVDGGKFKSVSALTDFLKQAGSDPKLYNKYFEWRNDWTMKLTSANEGHVQFSREYFCPLCEKLHEDHKPKVITNVQKWYEQEKCKEYPKMTN